MAAENLCLCEEVARVPLVASNSKALLQKQLHKKHRNIGGPTTWRVESAQLRISEEGKKTNHYTRPDGKQRGQDRCPKVQTG